MEDQSGVATNPYNFAVVYAYVDYGNVEANQQKLMFVESIKAVYPGIQILDVSCQVDQKYLMIARCQMYNHVRKTYRGNLLFLDTDILAYYPDPDLFDGYWDLGFVGRDQNYPLMPYCGSFIASKDTGAALEWFDIYQKTANNNAQGLVDNGWWTDQLAMRHAELYMNAGNGVYRSLETKLFDHKLYNFTPDAPVGTNAHFIHFKGPERKKLMLQYYKGLRGTDYVTFK